MALWLLSGAFSGIPNSLQKWANQMAPLEAFVGEMYSAFVVDSATILWSLDHQEIAPLARVYIWPLVDLCCREAIASWYKEQIQILYQVRCVRLEPITVSLKHRQWTIRKSIPISLHSHHCNFSYVYFVHGDSNEQPGYHASHVTHLCQVAIKHHMHFMRSHIHHMHLNTCIRRRKGGMWASIKQSWNQMINSEEKYIKRLSWLIQKVCLSRWKSRIRLGVLQT